MRETRGKINNKKHKLRKSQGKKEQTLEKLGFWLNSLKNEYHRLHKLKNGSFKWLNDHDGIPNIIAFLAQRERRCKREVVLEKSMHASTNIIDGKKNSAQIKCMRSTIIAFVKQQSILINSYPNGYISQWFRYNELMTSFDV